MKKLIYTLSLVLLGTTLTFAQCHKNCTLASSLTEYLDSAGVLQRSVSENSRIEVSDTEVIIEPDNKEYKITGAVQAITCQWKVPYEEGKTTINATLTDTKGFISNGILTIEGKDGSITFVMEADEMLNRIIRLKVDTFREKQ